MKSLILLFAVVTLVACGGADQSVGSGNISEPSTPVNMLRSMPDEVKAIFASLNQKPKAEPLAFALVDRELPNGVTAVVRINQRGDKARYVVVSSRGYSSSTAQLAISAAGWYSAKRGDDVSPVTITVYADGRTEAVSEALGTLTGRIVRFGPAVDTSTFSARVLKRIEKSQQTFDVPGFGPSKFLDK